MADSKIYGVEIEKLSATIAQKLYPDAEITISGFEKTKYPDNLFDVAVGNVPFGSHKVKDTKFDKHKFVIHDYFFAKSLDKLRPGGVLAFITSKGTLDKENSKVREYLGEKADLLGAIRLPSSTFKANAGTEVTSDIIFLQKREATAIAKPTWLHTGMNQDGIRMNQYFVDHPEMIIGSMELVSGPHGMETSCVLKDQSQFKELLKQAVTNIQGHIPEYEHEELPEIDSKVLPATPDVRNYAFTVIDDTIYYRENSIMIPQSFNGTATARIKALIPLRDTLRGLITAQTEDYPEEEIKALQEELNTHYDKFTKKYGYVGSVGNQRAFDQDSTYPLLTSLENFDEKGNYKGKADIFTKRTIRPKIEITHVDTAVEALMVSLNEHGRVDLDYMAGLLNTTTERIKSDLVGVVFHNPTYEDTDIGWETADQYLSGNVRNKLAVAVEKAEHNPMYLVNVDKLEEVQPVDLEPQEISIRIGSTWVDKKYYEQFMLETFEPPMNAKHKIHVQFASATGSWFIDGKGFDKNGIKATTTYGMGAMDAYSILEKTLNLKTIKITEIIKDSHGKECRVTNEVMTDIARAKQDLIREAFQSWIWKDPQRRMDLCTLYNQRFNAHRTREFDGSFLKCAGMNPDITLLGHQRNAIARTLLGGNTLLAHVVGAGKTYEMIAAAQESKRLGLCHKSMIAVPNHIINQFASDYLKLYPSANILVTTKKEFEKSRRKKFCSKIATGDYDAVIIGHSQLGKLPMSIERQEAFINSELEEIMSGIKELESNDAEKYSIKELERIAITLEDKLKALHSRTKQDDVITFEELGIDKLFIDESHRFKNLLLYSKMTNVAGISQTHADKSSDLYMKCKYLDEITGGKGIVFASGTPISNSMAELYTVQRYLQYHDLKANGLTHFDSWASTFGETVTDTELAPEGTGYRVKTRFSKFHNLPELMTMFKQIADIQTADMLNLPTPQVTPHVIQLLPSAFQKQMVFGLAKRADNIRAKLVDPSVDNMPLITSDGRKIALDQRLSNPLLPDDPNSKSSICTETVYEIWTQTMADKSAQLIFCDQSVPHYDGLFNVYDDMKNKLISKGIPEDEISFIHDAKTDKQKELLFAKVNSGDVRVLIGSTQKMGAGTNVQKRLIALHHMDCPWRPSDLEQRVGRLVRRGNMNEMVHVYTYVTENTFDAYSYQLVENKQKFIAQIMSSKSPMRTFEDTDGTALSYAEIKALATGNPLIKERMDLEVQISRLTSLKNSYLHERYRLEDNVIKHLPLSVANCNLLINGYHKDIKHLTDNTLVNENNFSPMVIQGTVYYQKKEAGTALIELLKTTEIDHRQTIEIGRYRGFNMTLSFDCFSSKHSITLKNSLSHDVELGSDPLGNILRMDNKLSSFKEKIVSTTDHLSNYQTQLERAKEELKKPFTHEIEITEKQQRLAEVMAEMTTMEQENKAEMEQNIQEDDYEMEM